MTALKKAQRAYMLARRVNVMWQPYFQYQSWKWLFISVWED